MLIWWKIEMIGKHKHKWFVHGTSVDFFQLLLKCDCGASGVVEDPTMREWEAAFDAPSNPYRWKGGDHRVIVTGNAYNK